MAEALETYRGVVYPWQMDHMDHMNVQHYVAKFDEATWQLFAHIGMTSRYFRDENRGMAAVRQTLNYLRELHAGDLVVIRSGVVEIEGRKMRWRHRMIDCESGEEAATAELLGVHIDRAARAACAFPNEIVAAGRRLQEASA